MNAKMDRVKRKIDEIKKEREELREKYNYLVEEMKKAIDKNSQNIEFLKNQLGGLSAKEGEGEEDVSDIRSAVNSLEKSIKSLEGKHSILKEKLKEEVGLAKDTLSSEISEEMKGVRSQLVDDIKSEVEMSIQDVKAAEKDIKKLSDKQDKSEEKISNLRSYLNSLNKSMEAMSGKQAVLKEKVTEDMKSIGKDINSRLLERVRGINANVKTQLKDAMDKNAKSIMLIEEKVNRVVDSHEGYENSLSGILDDMNSLKKSVSELAEVNTSVKNSVMQRVNLLEKEINSELSKVKGFEERLNKDVEDFEKFAGGQKTRNEKFESKISNRIDMFAVEMENLKRDFTSISNDFKNIGGRLDSLRDKSSDLKQHTEANRLELENFKKMTEEVLSKSKEDQTVFKENLVSKLNEASEKILNRLSQNEIKSSSEIAKQSEEIKLFRAHVTHFINDLVSNYEKRFEMMKSEIDQALRILEERSKEQRAMIFE